MKRISLYQIYAFLALAVSVFYLVFVVHDDQFYLLYVLKVILLGLFACCMLFVPKRYSKLFSIPIFLFLLITLFEIYQTASSSSADYLIDYFIKYGIEMGTFFFVIFGLFGLVHRVKLYKILMLCLLIIYLLWVLLSLFGFVLYSEYDYIPVFALYYIPQLSAASSTLSWITKSYRTQ
jgi:hypothetical protein